MRTYPNNSPLAAARIVALTLIADGHLKAAEMHALQEANAYASLHLNPAMLRQVMQDLCADLLQDRLDQGRTDIRISPDQIKAVLNEIDEPALRHRIFGVCLEAAYADDVIHEGEVTLLAEALQRWSIDDHNIETALRALRPSQAPAARSALDCH